MTVPGVSRNAGEGGLLGLAVSPEVRAATGWSTRTSRAAPTTGSCASSWAVASARSSPGCSRPGSTTAGGSPSGPTASSTRAWVTRGTRRWPSSATRRTARSCAWTRTAACRRATRSAGRGCGRGAIATCRGSRGTARGRLWASEFGQNIARRGQPDPQGAQLRVAGGRGCRVDRGRALHEPRGDVGDVGGLAERRRDHRSQPVRGRAAGRVRVEGPARAARRGQADADARRAATGASARWSRRRTARCGWRRPTATGAGARAIGDDRIVAIRVIARLESRDGARISRRSAGFGPGGDACSRGPGAGQRRALAAADGRQPGGLPRDRGRGCSRATSRRDKPISGLSVTPVKSTLPIEAAEHHHRGGEAGGRDRRQVHAGGRHGGGRGGHQDRRDLRRGDGRTPSSRAAS